MGASEREKHDETPPVKPKEDVTEALSKLLTDFNSVAFLKSSLDSTSDTSFKGAECEELSSSLKNLHLKKPAESRKKCKDKRNLARKGKHSHVNKYNLSVAAVSVQKPVVWPGKLNGSPKKEEDSLLQPSRLSLGSADSDKEKASLPFESFASTSSGDERSRIERQLKYQNAHQFGSISKSECNTLSFSQLSEAHSKTELSCDDDADESDLLPTMATPVKRSMKCYVPAAKHRRVYSEIHAGSDMAQCLDYRCSVPREDCLTLEANGSSCSYDNNNRLGLTSLIDRENTTAPSVSSNDDNCDRSCSSVEERMDESNVNELAYYFDDLLHIPKKMSVMAEMMYL